MGMRNMTGKARVTCVFGDNGGEPNRYIRSWRRIKEVWWQQRLLKGGKGKQPRLRICLWKNIMLELERELLCREGYGPQRVNRGYKTR